jgi:hypothetical protein
MALELHARATVLRASGNRKAVGGGIGGVLLALLLFL